MIEIIDEWEPHQEPWVYIRNRINICGCGTYPEQIDDDLWDMFVYITEKHDNAYKVYSKTKYHELIVHLLETTDLIEHGFSIGSSRLSSDGEKFWKEVTKHHWQEIWSRSPDSKPLLEEEKS